MSVAAMLSAACTDSGEKKASLPPAEKVSVESTKVGSTPASAGDHRKSLGNETPEARASNTREDDVSAVSAAATPPLLSSVKGESSGSEMQYRLTGAVSSTRKANLAFRVGGFIAKIEAEPGTVVKKGAVLAVLDDRDFVMRIELAKAKRDLAKVGLESAQEEFEREQQLKKENASTGTAFDKVRAVHDQAELNLKLAELDLRAARDALEDTKLKAPYDCVVAKKLKDEAEHVHSGQAGAATVFEIYGTGGIEISLEAPELLASQFALGTELKVIVPSSNFSGNAKIVRLVPVISEKTRTFQIIAKLDSSESRVLPGSYAEATLVR